MSLTVTVSNSTPTPPVQVVTPQAVRDQATANGRPAANDALAITIPIINIDLTGTHWNTFGSGASEEFAFNTGTIKIALRQEIFIANDLSACARGVWLQHENLHVADNVAILNRMPTEVANDSSLQAIFVAKQRFPRSQFSLIQQAVIEMIGDVFRRLTAHDATARDTRREYSRVNQLIIRSCPGPHFHTVVSGENLSVISDFYYGTQSHAMRIYERNRAVIGSNANLIRPGQKLELPVIGP